MKIELDLVRDSANTFGDCIAITQYQTADDTLDITLSNPDRCVTVRKEDLIRALRILE